VRRTVRRAEAARADTTAWTRLGSALDVATSIGVGVAVLGGVLASLREEIAARPGATGGVLPGGTTGALVTLLAVAGAVLVLDRLGPVSATPAAAAWWLPLPADRRGLLRGELVRLAAGCGLAGAGFGLTAALMGGTPPASVPAAAAAGAAAGVALVAAAAVLQARGASGRVGPVAGGVLVGTALGAALVATAGAAGGSPATSAPPPGPGWAWGAALLAPVAGGLLVVADRGLGRLRAGELRVLGGTAAHAGASVLSMDTRELGRALAGRRERAPRRPWRFARVRGPVHALVAAEVAGLLRGRWQAGQVVVGIALPVLAARTQGLNQLPVVGWLAFVAGWALVAVAAGHPARQAQAAPAVDRLLPLSPAQLTWARCVVPLAVAAGACALTGLLVGTGSGAPAAWAGVGLATAPGWAAAAVRGAYRPELDWSGPVMSTPMGAVPTGVAATLVHGLDVGVVASVPLLLALLVGGDPAPGLVAGQLGWAAAVGAAGVALTARRRSAGEPAPIRPPATPR
jgi:hypothetical protein